ncbi:CHAD domain-containing protein [Azotobacter vinelandii]|uniref:CHAD domain-containing protein n=1 Tax=Azotobacter vinelandii TaxID=354 RepID=UPI0007739313|nr:CHAD domain-containing protein [Azotobacter vinelandii]
MIADRLQERVLRLDVALQACAARLAAHSDDQALHDLRVALRRLRSLLRPLRGLPGIDPLELAAAAMGRLSTPLRDDEVLLRELQAAALDELVGTRRERLEAGRDGLLASAEWRQLCNTLVVWPSLWRQAGRDGALRGLRRRIGKGQARQARRLGEALRDPAHDRHRLRLLIKRVRYGAEAYPDLVDLSEDGAKRLKRAQAALGDWHDRLQWLARAERETDLEPLTVRWREELEASARRADRVLTTLARDFA